MSRLNSPQFLFNYTVHWAAVTHGVLGVTKNATVPGTSYNIQGLAPFTTYRIRVATRDWDRNGIFSNSVWVQTLEGGKFNGTTGTA